VLGIGPTYVAYPMAEPAPVYRHWRGVRHSYRRVRHPQQHPTG